MCDLKAQEDEGPEEGEIQDDDDEEETSVYLSSSSSSYDRDIRNHERQRAARKYLPHDSAGSISMSIVNDRMLSRTNHDRKEKSRVRPPKHAESTHHKTSAQPRSGLTHGKENRHVHQSREKRSSPVHHSGRPKSRTPNRSPHRDHSKSTSKCHRGVPENPASRSSEVAERDSAAHHTRKRARHRGGTRKREAAAEPKRTQAKKVKVSHYVENGEKIDDTGSNVLNMVDASEENCLKRKLLTMGALPNQSQSVSTPLGVTLDEGVTEEVPDNSTETDIVHLPAIEVAPIESNEPISNCGKNSEEVDSGVIFVAAVPKALPELVTLSDSDAEQDTNVEEETVDTTKGATDMEMSRSSASSNADMDLEATLDISPDNPPASSLGQSDQDEDDILSLRRAALMSKNKPSKGPANNGEQEDDDLLLRVAALRSAVLRKAEVRKKRRLQTVGGQVLGDEMTPVDMDLADTDDEEDSVVSQPQPSPEAPPLPMPPLPSDSLLKTVSAMPPPESYFSEPARPCHYMPTGFLEPPLQDNLCANNVRFPMDAPPSNLFTGMPPPREIGSEMDGVPLSRSHSGFPGHPCEFPAQAQPAEFPPHPSPMEFPAQGQPVEFPPHPSSMEFPAQGQPVDFPPHPSPIEFPVQAPVEFPPHPSPMEFPAQAQPVEYPPHPSPMDFPVVHPVPPPLEYPALPVEYPPLAVPSVALDYPVSDPSIDYDPAVPTPYQDSFPETNEPLPTNFTPELWNQDEAPAAQEPLSSILTKAMKKKILNTRPNLREIHLSNTPLKNDRQESEIAELELSSMLVLDEVADSPVQSPANVLTDSDKAPSEIVQRQSSIDEDETFLREKLLKAISSKRETNKPQESITKKSDQSSSKPDSSSASKTQSSNPPDKTRKPAGKAQVKKGTSKPREVVMSKERVVYSKADTLKVQVPVPPRNTYPVRKLDGAKQKTKTAQAPFQLIIQLGEDSDSSDGFENLELEEDANALRRVPSMYHMKEYYPRTGVAETEKAPEEAGSTQSGAVPCRSELDLSKEVDKFLKDVRSSHEASAHATPPESPTVSQVAVLKPIHGTPLAIRHLPASTQEEYRKLKQIIAEKELQKKAQKKPSTTLQTQSKVANNKSNPVAQPIVKAAQPYAKAAQPIAKAAQPIVKAAQPIVKATQPIVKATQPIAKATQPIAKATQPIAKATQPIAKATQPVSVAAQPIAPAAQLMPKAATPISTSTKTKAAQSIVKAAQSIASAAQPIASAAQPIASAAQPNASAGQPIASAAQAIASAAQPIASAAQPIASAAQPIASAAQPNATSAQPIAKATQPVATATLPIATATLPIAASARPVTQSTKVQTAPSPTTSPKLSVAQPTESVSPPKSSATPPVLSIPPKPAVSLPASPSLLATVLPIAATGSPTGFEAPVMQSTSIRPTSCFATTKALFSSPYSVTRSVPKTNTDFFRGAPIMYGQCTPDSVVSSCAPKVATSGSGQPVVINQTIPVLHPKATASPIPPAPALSVPALSAPVTQQAGEKELDEAEMNLLKERSAVVGQIMGLTRLQNETENSMTALDVCESNLLRIIEEFDAASKEWQERSNEVKLMMQGVKEKREQLRGSYVRTNSVARSCKYLGAQVRGPEYTLPVGSIMQSKQRIANQQYGRMIKWRKAEQRRMRGAIEKTDTVSAFLKSRCQESLSTAVNRSTDSCNPSTVLVDPRAVSVNPSTVSVNPTVSLNPLAISVSSCDMSVSPSAMSASPTALSVSSSTMSISPPPTSVSSSAMSVSPSAMCVSPSANSIPTEGDRPLPIPVTEPSTPMKVESVVTPLPVRPETPQVAAPQEGDISESKNTPSVFCARRIVRVAKKRLREGGKPRELVKQPLKLVLGADDNLIAEKRKQQVLTSYQSPLDHLGNSGSHDVLFDPEAILCPYELNGKCEDNECAFQHQVKSAKRAKADS